MQRKESTSKLHNAAKALRRSLSGKNIPNKYKSDNRVGGSGNAGDEASANQVPRRSQSMDKIKRRSITSSTMTVDNGDAENKERHSRKDKRSHSFHGGKGDAKKLAKVANMMRRETKPESQDPKKRQSLDVSLMRRNRKEKYVIINGLNILDHNIVFNIIFFQISRSG